jgi:hypothetical protein
LAKEAKVRTCRAGKHKTHSERYAEQNGRSSAFAV